jgi:hypothetical protein
MKRPDLLVLVAIWEFVSAFFALVGIVLVGALAFPAMIDALWGDALIGGVVALGFGVLLLLGTVGLGVVAGIGLLTGKEWGRILAIIHAVLGLFNVPVGTVVGVLVLIYLTRPEVTEYFKGPPSAVA